MWTVTLIECCMMCEVELEPMFGFTRGCTLQLIPLAQDASKMHFSFQTVHIQFQADTIKAF
jgi:hypothetical protein